MKATTILRLPQYLRQLKQEAVNLDGRVNSLDQTIAANDVVQKQLQDSIQVLDGKIDSLSNEIERLRIRNAELEHIANTKHTVFTTDTPQMGVIEDRLFADDHDLDAFYLEFENRFRGSEEEIREKQTPYITVFEQANLDKKRPIIDLGCGRGEFLKLLAEHHFKAIGIDLNEAMVQSAIAQGFTAVQDDGISYLMSQKSNSLSGITGFHLAEHIPFRKVLLLMSEAYRCLRKGGILLLETPNPENVFVGAFTFHYDPSHLKPLPPAIMQFSALFKGFERAEIMRMQPELTEEAIIHAVDNTQLQDVLRRLYGARDYALVAYK